MHLETEDVDEGVMFARMPDVIQKTLSRRVSDQGRVDDESRGVVILSVISLKSVTTC